MSESDRRKKHNERAKKNRIRIENASTAPVYKKLAPLVINIDNDVLAMASATAKFATYGNLGAAEAQKFCREVLPKMLERDAKIAISFTGCHNFASDLDLQVQRLQFGLGEALVPARDLRRLLIQAHDYPLMFIREAVNQLGIIPESEEEFSECVKRWKAEEEENARQQPARADDPPGNSEEANDVPAGPGPEEASEESELLDD